MMLSWEQVLCFVIDLMLLCQIDKLRFLATYAAPGFQDVVFLKGFDNEAMVYVCCKGSWSRHTILVHDGRYTTIASDPVDSIHLLRQVLQGVAQGSVYRESGWPGFVYPVDGGKPKAHVLLAFKKIVKPMYLPVGGTWKSAPWRAQTLRHMESLGDAQVQEYPPHLQSNWRHTLTDFERLNAWTFGTSDDTDSSD